MGGSSEEALELIGTRSLVWYGTAERGGRGEGKMRDGDFGRERKSEGDPQLYRECAEYSMVRLIGIKRVKRGS